MSPWPRPRLRAAGRGALGIIHDFVMLNALRDTRAAEAAITQVISTLGTALGAD